MADANYYEILQVSTQANQAEIKQAYRRLAKLFHPDSQRESANHERIVKLNQAYEVLGDAHRRRSYDQQIFSQDSYQASTQRQYRNAYAQQYYRRQRQSNRQSDLQLEQWLKEVYHPVSHLLCQILKPLDQEIDNLAADPFDDELMAEFQNYLNIRRTYLQQAQITFNSCPNPAQFAGVAANLFYCLNNIGDGIDELEFFTLNYDEHYLHTGKEIFRIANGLRCEAEFAMNSNSC